MSGNTRVEIEEQDDMATEPLNHEADDRVEVAAPAAADKPAESKRSKFLRLIARRGPIANKAIQAVGNLFRRGQYDFSPGDAERTVAMLRAEVDAIELAARGQAPKPMNAWLFQS
jgi:hypothetical protein